MNGHAPRRVALPVVIVACACATLSSVAHARSELALPLLALRDERPELLLAQRTIEREWGMSEDSVYVERDVPGWRSEGIAMMLSAAVPGAGQAYVGDGSGLWFALAEVAAWTARLVWLNRGDELRDQAAVYAGVPSDSASTWSFERWEESSNSVAAELRALYQADREAFYDRIGGDAQYLAGWTGDPAQSRAAFQELRGHSDDRLRYARYAQNAVWLNHIVAAVHALRSARLHNLSLGTGMSLRVKGGWHRGPDVVAAFERKF